MISASQCIIHDRQYACGGDDMDMSYHGSIVYVKMANGSLCQQILGLMLLAVLFWAISRGIFLTAAPSLASGRAHDDNVGLKVNPCC